MAFSIGFASWQTRRRATSRRMRLPFESLVPLPEVIAASTGKSVASIRVGEQYEKMLAEIGPEFHILREAPIEEIRQKAGLLIAEGIERLRSGRVERTPGYDGEYGKIEILRPEDIAKLQGQLSFFRGGCGKTARKQAAPAGIKKRAGKENSAAADEGEQLNAEQRAAVCAADRRTAGDCRPGDGQDEDPRSPDRASGGAGDKAGRDNGCDLYAQSGGGDAGTSGKIAGG